MERHQSSMKYRLAVCFVAVCLAIGLTAMPALAEPSADKGSSISIVSVDTSSDAADEAADEKTGSAKKDTASSEKAPSKTSASSEKTESKSEATEAKKQPSEPVDTDVLNPAEKLGAVLEGEGEAAMKNATGITAPAEDEDGEEELDEKEQAKQEIKSSIMAMSGEVRTYYGDLTINKTFVSGPLYTVLDKDGNPVVDRYTVLFEIEGRDANNNVIYKKRSIGLTVDKNGTSSTTLEHIPAGFYTVTEITYPGCGYEPTNGTQKVQVSELKEQQGGSKLTFTFENTGTAKTEIPNEGFVNKYENHDGLGFGWLATDR